MPGDPDSPCLRKLIRKFQISQINPAYWFIKLYNPEAHLFKTFHHNHVFELEVSIGLIVNFGYQWEVIEMLKLSSIIMSQNQRKLNGLT
jgi:hypothetical protein